MAFEPLNDPVSTEPFDDADGFDLSAEQQITDGMLKLRGTAVLQPNPDLNWVEATWSQTSQFRPIPDETAPEQAWGYQTNVNTSIQAQGKFPYSDPFLRRTNLIPNDRRRPGSRLTDQARRNLRIQTAEILDPGENEPTQERTGPRGKLLIGRRRAGPYGRRVLKLESTAVGQYDYIQQNTSESESFWPDTVGTNNGWTVEFRASFGGFESDGTSELILDDGNHRVNLYLMKKGIFLDTSGYSFVCPVYWAEDFKKVRISVLGDNLFILTEDGFGYAGTSSIIQSPSVAKDLKIGYLGNTTGLMYLDYFHQSHLGVYLDIQDDIGWVADTNQWTTTTPALSHNQKVNQFQVAAIKSVAPYSGGDTDVQTQYRNTSNPTWTNFGSAVTLSAEYQEIDLSSLPVDSDGTDELRFQLSQQAFSTSERPAPIDEIQVLTDFDPPEITLNPDHGPVSGGNVVSILSQNGATLSVSDDIYVAGVQVPAGDINYIDVTETQVVWPAGTVGPASVRVDTGGDNYFPDRPYRYLPSYDKGIDRSEQLARVCGTRSAFRIKNEVPNGEVNLAYLSAPGIEAESHVGLIDLSYLESANVVGGSAEPTLLVGSTIDASGSTFTYQDPPNTNELAIAVGAAGWRELGVPAPLYYYHVLGRGRYYVRKEQSSLSLEELRDSLSVHYSDGVEVALNDYPWDIVLTSKNIHGEDLPANTYLVVLLTNKKYIPGETVFVTTTVVDPSNQMKLIQGYTEVVNPKLVFREAPDANFTYDVETHPTTGHQTINIREI